MSVEKIKKLIVSNVGKEINFRYNGARNQVEEFRGKIVSCYNSVFIIELEETSVIKSFAYIDILIGNLEICL